MAGCWRFAGRKAGVAGREVRITSLELSGIGGGRVALEWVAGKLHEGLNRRLADEVRLEGTVQEVRILGVRARRDGLVVRVAATADATLYIEGGGS